MSPAIDSTITLERLPRSGDVVKLAKGAEVETVGGKGLNVARWLARRGECVALGGLLGSEGASRFERELAANGIRDAMLRVPGPTRRNCMFTSSDGMFKMNWPAFPDLASDQWSDARIEALLLGEAAGAGEGAVAILSGSLPPSVPSGFYASFARRLAARGVEVALDASGAPLRQGVAACPAILKPNRDEAAELLGMALETEDDLVRALRTMLDFSPVVILSDGDAGCWFATRGESPSAPRVWRVPSPRVDVIDTTAAGDTLLAEFCHRFYPARELTEDVMRWAVAAGSAATTRPGAEPPAADLVERLHGETVVHSFLEIK